MKKGAKKERKSMQHMEEMGMWLDRYGDIFSDFDNRPFNQRSMSFDFLAEAKRESRDKLGKIKLNLFMPKSKRNANDEKAIKKRMSEYFCKHYDYTKMVSRNVFKKGLVFCGFGVILMFFATYFLFYFESKSFLMSFLVILLEPGGWFLFWEGLALTLFESKRTKPNLEFYKKMSKAKIYFNSY